MEGLNFLLAVMSLLASLVTVIYVATQKHTPTPSITEKKTPPPPATEHAWIELSGAKQEFKTGAVRDAATDKVRPDLISPFAEERLGKWLNLGAEKYSERNWEKGIPMSRCLASLCRHLMKFRQGAKDEDHLAAILFNAMAIIHYEEMIARGVLPETLSDLPKYEGSR